MCQYNTDAPVQRPPSPGNKHFEKKKWLKKGYNSHDNWWILP